jgi:beta-glucanase (GH16 family)
MWIRSAAAILICAAGLAAAPPAGYKLAWADEFDGTAVDRSKWDYRTDSKHWSTQKPENVVLESGNLVLVLKKEKALDKEYSGAGVISKKAFGFGYYEARFKIAAGKGWHSSFWMMRHDGQGGTGTEKAALELDVIENDSVNLNSYGINTHKWNGQHVSYGHKNVATPPLSEYHTYGCEYTADQVKYYFDGALQQTVDLTALVKGDENIWLTSIASYLGKTDKVDDGRLPGKVWFDYVRFYEKAGEK